MRRPRFIAAQARYAKGPLGRLIAWIMARETWRDNLRAIEALGLESSDQTLDVGTGHGRALSEVAARTSSGLVTGVDPSELMVEIATAHNQSLVGAKRIQVLKANAEKLPFPAKTFDKAMAVHALYFWPRLRASFLEIARVLKPGGRLALLFRSAEDEQAVAAFPSGIYRFPPATEVISALVAAGFSVDRVDSGNGQQRRMPVLITATRCN